MPEPNENILSVFITGIAHHGGTFIKHDDTHAFVDIAVGSLIETDEDVLLRWKQTAGQLLGLGLRVRRVVPAPAAPPTPVPEGLMQSKMVRAGFMLALTDMGATVTKEDEAYLFIDVPRTSQLNQDEPLARLTNAARELFGLTLRVRLVDAPAGP